MNATETEQANDEYQADYHRDGGVGSDDRHAGGAGGGTASGAGGGIRVAAI